jgi:hypothetical protein
MRGTVRKRTTKDGPRYDVIYRAGGKQIWRTFETRKAADDHLVNEVSAVAAGTYRRINPDSMTAVFENWKTALDADLVLGALKRSTYRSYVSVLTRHLIPAFGAYRSDALTDARSRTGGRNKPAGSRQERWRRRP